MIDTGFLIALVLVTSSADTLCYFGSLLPVFEASRKALKPDGLLGFTLEDAGDTAVNSRLNSHGRYSHTKSYTKKTLVTVGFKVLSISSEILRKEDGQGVSGFVVVAKKKTL